MISHHKHAMCVCAVDSEKMSKSLGNFFTIRDVIAKYHPLVLRWFLLNTQYRQAINYSLPALDEVRLMPCPALPCPALPCPCGVCRDVHGTSCQKTTCGQVSVLTTPYSVLIESTANLSHIRSPRLQSYPGTSKAQDCTTTLLLLTAVICTVKSDF